MFYFSNSRWKVSKQTQMMRRISRMLFLMQMLFLIFWMQSSCVVSWHICFSVTSNNKTLLHFNCLWLIIKESLLQIKHKHFPTEMFYNKCFGYLLSALRREFLLRGLLCKIVFNVYVFVDGYALKVNFVEVILTCKRKRLQPFIFF